MGAKLLLLIVLSCSILGVASASYQVTHINVNMSLNSNTSAHINETIAVLISNQSVQQYTTNRAALNLTLSKWQALIGPQLVQHIINPTGSIYNFKFLPGPAITGQNSNSGSMYTAYMIMSYDVNNVTTVNQISPRTFEYTLNPKVFNFNHAASGEILSQNTTFNIRIPNGAIIKAVYPVPDSPAYAFATNYKNITDVAWSNSEPFNSFSFVFVIGQSIRGEVGQFISGAYDVFGIYTYLLIVLVIVGFILYIYYRASVNK